MLLSHFIFHDGDVKAIVCHTALKLDKMFGSVNGSVLNNIKQLYTISLNTNYF